MKDRTPRFRPLRPGPLRALPPFALCVAAALLSTAGCGGKGSASLVGREPVKRVVKVESDVDALRAWSTNRARSAVLVRIDPSDGLATFPVGAMQDIEGAAKGLAKGDAKSLDRLGPLIEQSGVATIGYMSGMYARIVWIVPGTKPVSETSPAWYRSYFVERRQFPAAAVGEFKAEGPVITGSITGIPLTIARLGDLSLAPDEDAIVDIDLAYFLATKAQDPSYRTGVKTLLAFLRDLAARNVKATIVTVNLDNQANAVPMDLRYYGDVIARALANPNDLNGPLPERWKYMIEAEDSLAAGRYASAAALYQDLLRTVKDDPGLYFGLAIAEGLQDKGLEARAALLSAYSLDGEYLRGFFQLARVLAAEGKVSAGFELVDTPDLSKILSRADMDYQRGMFYYTAHKPFDAITYLVLVAQQQPKNFGLFTVLFRAYREAGDERGQSWTLRKLTEIDDGRVRREMPWVYADLGRLYDKQGFWGSASEMYAKYIQAKPGDSLSTVFEKRIAAWRAKGMLKK